MSRIICATCLTYDVWVQYIHLEDALIIPPQNLYCEECQSYNTHIITHRTDSDV